MLRLRQIALVGRDLEAARADITAVLGLGEAYADPGVGTFGLVNAVWPVGDTFLEVVSPKQPGTTAGRLLDKRGGDGGYMAIFQTDDVDASRARAADAGVRIIEQVDRKNVRMSHFHPKDLGGAIVSVDWMDPPEHWEWGGPDWRRNVRTDVSTAIVGCELQGDDPEGMAAKWAQVLGRPCDRSGGGWRIGLDGGELRFVQPRDRRGEGLGVFDVAVRDPSAVRRTAGERGLIDENGDVILCGTRVRFVAA